MKTIRLPSAGITSPPLSPLRDAAWIAEHVFGGHVTSDWVRRNVPGKRKLGRIVVWYEDEARREAEGMLVARRGAA